MYLTWLKKYSLLIFDEIDSTNSEALKLAQTCRVGNFLIWARAQTKGRGRHGKNWQSERGNLYLSLLLNENIPITKQPQLSFVTALAVYDLVYGTVKKPGSSSNVKLKWPNDVLVNGKKIAGILLESLSFNDNTALVIGVGLNVQTFPVDINQPATSLMNELTKNYSLEEMINVFMTSFEKYYSLWQQSGFIGIRKLWLKRATKLNETVTVDDGNNKTTGIFKDIDFNGGIRIKVEDGKIYTLSAGQVFFGDDANA